MPFATNQRNEADQVYTAGIVYRSPGNDETDNVRGVFTSYDDARAHAVKEIQEEFDDDEPVYGLVVEYPLNHPRAHEVQRVWRIARDGIVLQSYDARTNEFWPILDNTYTGKYEVGDIVFVRANPWNPYSDSGSDQIGVVCKTPEMRRTENAELDLQDPGFIAETPDQPGETSLLDSYYIDTISDQGLLWVAKVAENGIESFNDELPQELWALRSISDMYLGKCIIDNEAWEKVKRGDMALLDLSYPVFREAYVRTRGPEPKTE